MYLAAKDESTPAINGYTIATRVENFIKELGLIGRAHNWDATRYHSTTGQSEEYDDLQGDKPSCYSGVKRRLFQSVQGHPLLALLTKDTLHQEVREIVREHFIHRITDENCVELNKAWEAIIDGNTQTDTSILNELNFTEEELHQHISSISEKYGSKLDGDLMAYLHRTINVMVPFKNLAEKFGGETDLSGILVQKLATIAPKKPSKEEVRQARLKMFDNAPSSEGNQSSKHQGPKK